MSIENRICNSIAKHEMYKDAHRIVKAERAYKDYKRTMSDEEFAKAWKQACSKVKEGLKC